MGKEDFVGAFGADLRLFSRKGRKGAKDAEGRGKRRVL